MSQADEAGFIEKDGVRYGTVRALETKFNLSWDIINTRIKSYSIQPIKGRGSLGHIYDFYPESEIRSLCADQLQYLPQADEAGFIEKDGVKYLTAGLLSRTLGISINAIMRRSSPSSVRLIKGKRGGGQICNFYSESDVRFVCADLLTGLPQADEDGFFEQDGILYGSSNVWGKKLNIHYSTIVIRLKKENILPIKGRHMNGGVFDFYSEPAVHAACKDLLNPDLTQADKSGFFEKNDIRYGTIFAWSKILPISADSIKRRLKKSNTPSTPGKTRIGRKVSFYPEPAVRAACSDLLQPEQVADLLNKKNNS